MSMPTLPYSGQKKSAGHQLVKTTGSSASDPKQGIILLQYIFIQGPSRVLSVNTLVRCITGNLQYFRQGIVRLLSSLE